MVRNLITAVLLVGSALAQHPHSHTPTNTTSDATLAELLQRPIALQQDIGEINDPVTTNSREANAFYQQGMAYLHSFVWVEAIRSFNQALRHDPELAMAHVGLARGYLNMGMMQQAAEEVERVRRLSTNASEREKRRIEATARQLEAIRTGTEESLAEYRSFLRQALDDFHHDSELWVLASFAAVSATEHGRHGSRVSMGYLTRALQFSPKHFGVHHYMAHTCEATDHPECTSQHSQVHAQSAPKVPHAQHMLGHTLRESGRAVEALQQFERADALHRKYLATEKVHPELDWHFAHNLRLLSGMYHHQGRLRESERVLRELLSLRLNDESDELARLDLIELLLKQRRFVEASKEADTMAASQSRVVRRMGLLLRGSAEIAQGRFRESGKFLRAAQKLDDSSDQFDTADRYAKALTAERWLRSGQHQKATSELFSLLMVFGASQHEGYLGALFTLERLFHAARQSKHLKAMEYLAHKMYYHDNSYPGTHLAAAEVAHMRGITLRRSELAAWVLNEWKDADSDAPAFLRATQLSNDTARPRKWTWEERLIDTDLILASPGGVT